MYSFTFSFFTIYVNVFLFGRLLWRHRWCFVCTCHVVSFEDAGCSVIVVTTSRSTRLSIILPITLALHMKKLSAKTTVLRDCSWVVLAGLHWTIFISWIDYYHLREELRIGIPLELFILTLDISKSLVKNITSCSISLLDKHHIFWFFCFDG